ncbi:hypothetical protein AALP_AA6G337800 [Arabis alpina]|uniref:Uncharacterized protein n=1 Tax=Arabis alpina TaxID=50452 RepID=A0A087GTF3_ARAAL|nr:hypothetical protein AALP_AA6G337800 [Arabis alpina]
MLVGCFVTKLTRQDSELGAAKEANAVLQSRLDEFAERNEVLERDALALQKVKKDYDDKLTKLKLRYTKAEGEVIQLRGELSSTSGLQHSRIDDAVVEARDEMARGFAEKTSEIAGLRHCASGVIQSTMLTTCSRIYLPVVSAGAVEASVAVDDDVEVLDEDDVEVIDDDEDVED